MTEVNSDMATDDPDPDRDDETLNEDGADDGAEDGVDDAGTTGATADLSLDRSIVLVGLMGAGKSAVGRRLAKRLGLPFTDTDKEVEAAAGCSVSDIFETWGEAAFRDTERRVIARLLDGPPQVLATGGGAYMAPDTRALITQRGLSVWLRAELDVLVERTARRNTRPLLRQGDPREILARLIAERYPIYAEADIVVDSYNAPLGQMVESVIAALRNHPAAPS